MRGTLFRGLAPSGVYEWSPQVSRSLLPTPHRPSTPLEGSSSTFTERERRGQSAFRNLLRARLSPPPSSPVRRARPPSGCSLFMIEHFLGYTFLQLNTVPELFTTRLSLSADQTYAPNQTLSVETANISPRDSEYKTCA